MVDGKYWSVESRYWDYREPYLPMFFRVTARHIRLSRTHRLLDIACGRAAIAFGFAPFVGSLTGIDIDEHALAIARATAQRNNVPIELLSGGIEDIPDRLAPIDIVTIGRAHDYLPREATQARLEQLLAPSGRVLICGTTTSDKRSGPWASAYRAARYRWGPREPPVTAEEFMKGSAFVYEITLAVLRTQNIAVEDLLLRALGFPKTTPEALGSRTDEFLQDIRSTLEPYAVNGMVSEVIETSGAIFRRADS